MRSRVSVFSYCRISSVFVAHSGDVNPLWYMVAAWIDSSDPARARFASFTHQDISMRKKRRIRRCPRACAGRSLCLLVPQIQSAGPISRLAYLRLYLRVAGRGAGENTVFSHDAPISIPPREIGLCQARKTSGTLLYCCCCGPASGIQDIWLLR